MNNTTKQQLSKLHKCVKVNLTSPNLTNLTSKTIDESSNKILESKGLQFLRNLYFLIPIKNNELQDICNKIFLCN